MATGTPGSLAGVPEHILAPAPSLNSGRIQPDDGYNVGYEEGTLHLGGCTSKVYLGHRKTCAQTRLGEAHSGHEYAYVYRDPFNSHIVVGGYYCDGLDGDRPAFPAEATPEDLATATTAWVERQPSLIDAYLMMANMGDEDSDV